jgi:orotidine-5'-phosphate decarboxylase
MDRIVLSKKSVIVATDVTTRVALESLAKGMEGIPGIGGFKLGFTLAMQDLERSVNIVRRHLGPGFPIIYDHQKAGNDIPEMGVQFAEVLEYSGVDAAILFPFTGPITQEAWTKACFGAGLQVITGGVMTHAKFLVSEGGYIADDSVERIYRNAACCFGCTHFVVPGTKLDWVKRIRSWLVNDLGEGNFVLYAPGFITQGGDISECGQAAGDEWHAIVGSAIYKRPTMEAQRQATIAVTSQITKTLT